MKIKNIFVYVLCADCRALLDELGRQYTGNIAVTETGRTCQAWAAQASFLFQLIYFFYIPSSVSVKITQ